MRYRTLTSLTLALLLACGAPAQTVPRAPEGPWTPPDRKRAPLSIDPSNGKVAISYDPAFCYQHAYDVSKNYWGDTIRTEYIEVFGEPPAKPAERIGWRDRSAIFLYVMPLADFASSDGGKIEVRSSGPNYLIVVRYPPTLPLSSAEATVAFSR